jgi:predicted nuclease with TOPRIM domain
VNPDVPERPQGEEKPEEKLARLRRTVGTLEDRVRMLEAENARLVDLLKKQGGEARTLSPTAVELPPPATEPLADNAQAWSGLDRDERALLDETRQGQALFFLARSKTTVDVGHWFSRGTLAVAATMRTEALSHPTLFPVSFSKCRDGKDVSGTTTYGTTPRAWS